MANDNSKHDTSYELVFTSTGKDGQKVSKSLSLKGGTTYSCTFNYMKESVASKGFEATPYSISYEKKMYQPCYIKAVIQLGMDKQSKTFASPTELRSIFNGQEIDYLIDGKTIAKKYKIFSISPVIKPDSVYVTLHVYSPDYLMTLDKYSKSYVAKKLGSDIFVEESKKFGFTNVYKPGVSGVIPYGQSVCYSTLSFVGYTYKNKNYEFIQPYLVQYNESFHDFLVRTANRCGEFLYYEDGILYLGGCFKNQDIEPLGNSYESITYKDYGDVSKVAVDTQSHDYTVKDAPHEAQAGKDANNNPLPLKEQYHSEVNRDDFLRAVSKDGGSTYLQQFGSIPKMITRAVANVLTKKNWVDALTNFVEDEAVRAVQAAANNSKINSSYNKEFLDKSKYDVEHWKNFTGDNDMVSEFSTFSQKTQKLSENKYTMAISKDGDDTIDRNSTTTPLDNINLTSGFYADILKLEEQSSRQLLSIEVGSTYRHLKLGGSFSYDGTVYCVISVSGTMDIATDAATGRKFWQQRQHVEAVPASLKYTNKEDNKEYYYPAPFVHPSGHIRRCQPQVAFVAQKDDPFNMGRVRVRYPWQAKDDAASPWIRVTTPLALPRGGFCLRLEEGCEVLVDYEGGNIECPYVAGSVFSQDSPDSFLQSCYSVIMQSPNGHYVRMKTPDNATPFVTGFLPITQTINGFLVNYPMNLNDGGSGFDKGLAGGIEMGDKFGIVSVNISTENRDISIRSPFGTVGISAWHGISISAPHGTIKIVGKNVDISASNNLTITSGTTIKENSERARDGFLSTLGKSALDAAGKYLDLSILRTVWETFVLPVEGSLTIKSFRYMHIEAGKGKTTYPVAAYNNQVNNKTASKLLNKQNVVREVTDTIKALINNYERAVSVWFQLQNMVIWSRKYYDRLLTKMEYNNKIKDTGKADYLIEKSYEGTAADTLCTEGNLFNNPQEIQERQEVIDAATALCARAASFYKYSKGRPVDAPINGGLVESLKVGLAGEDGFVHVEIYANDISSVVNDNAIKNTLISTFDPKNTPKDELLRKNEGNMGISVKEIRRKLLKGLLARLVTNKTLEHDVDKAGTALNSDNDWADYVKSVKFYQEKEDSALSVVKKLTLDTFYNEDMSLSLTSGNPFETAKWGTEQNGRILMSDNAAHTITFDNGNLSTRLNDDDTILMNILNKY